MKTAEMQELAKDHSVNTGTIQQLLSRGVPEDVLSEVLDIRASMIVRDEKQKTIATPPTGLFAEAWKACQNVEDLTAMAETASGLAERFAEGRFESSLGQEDGPRREDLNEALKQVVEAYKSGGIEGVEVLDDESSVLPDHPIPF